MKFLAATAVTSLALLAGGIALVWRALRWQG